MIGDINNIVLVLRESIEDLLSLGIIIGDDEVHN